MDSCWKSKTIDSISVEIWTRVFAIFCGFNGPKSGENLDRLFLVTDSTNNFFRARLKPQLVMVKAVIRDQMLHLQFKNLVCKVALTKVASRQQASTLTNVRGQIYEAFDCGKEAAQFFSQIMGEPSKLLMHQRSIVVQKAKSTFSDEFPYMIATQSSLNELNQTLNEKDFCDVSNANMRPNIVVEQCQAWDEQKWEEIQFGESLYTQNVAMNCVEPCFRCLMTTIDPQEGKLHPTHEPLVTLRSVSTVMDGNAPSFGVYANAKKEGFIYVGMTVWARYKNE
ncbi:unnamed protein product, partial [Mesorhabditis belari]|uniref:MOSC domain-containing protein n=1 Tax=Mesorhabditis belari TaxID=2138241 RepID=A0AAF3ENT3_9BILA